MNDFDCDGPVSDSAGSAVRTLRTNIVEKHPRKYRTQSGFQQEILDDEDEEVIGYHQLKRWWFASTVFPIIAGTFGPIASLMSVCALVRPWRVKIPEGGTESSGDGVADPRWLIAVNSISLALAILANVALLLNFAHRLRYSIAQPITVVFWYLSAILLIVPIGLSDVLRLDPRSSYAFSQSYYYGLISACLYFFISTALLMNMIGAFHFNAYPPSFNSLTIPQRTLMLQTISYSLYLAAAAAIFSSLEGWQYTNGIYWAQYTLLTIGLGSDFPLYRTVSRALLIPYSIVGIMMVALIVGSVRGLVLERGKVKVLRSALQRERIKWESKKARYTPDSSSGVDAWQNEFEAMRKMQVYAETERKYISLAVSLVAFATLWLLGALVFWCSERPQEWTYFEALFFAFTSLTTIGYGDFYPQSNSGKPFFVIWTIFAVPTVTILFSNIGNTILGWLKDGTVWLGQRTILPERIHKPVDSEQTDNEKPRRTSMSDTQLISRLSRHISQVAKDVGKKPPRKYSWSEWQHYLHSLAKDGTEFEWSWLDDKGPLFDQSTTSEAHWLLGKLCTRLEKVLEERVESVSLDGTSEA